MQPQFRIFLDREHQYYFQFFSMDQRCVFESIRFATKPLCAKGINELIGASRLGEHIFKTEASGACSFIVTSKRKVIIGSGRRHFVFIMLT